MEKYLILCRSMTVAQRSQRLLEHSGIIGSVIKAPLHLTKNGCGYALILRRHGAEGVRILKEQGMLTGKVYRMEDMEWKETGHDLP